MLEKWHSLDEEVKLALIVILLLFLWGKQMITVIEYGSIKGITVDSGGNKKIMDRFKIVKNAFEDDTNNELELSESELKDLYSILKRILDWRE